MQTVNTFPQNSYWQYTVPTSIVCGKFGGRTPPLPWIRAWHPNLAIAALGYNGPWLYRTLAIADRNRCRQGHG